MQFTALSCPQCGGTLPRQASWRMVICPFCGATVTRSKSVVEAARFHAAKLRVYEGARMLYDTASRVHRWHGQHFQVLKQVGMGEHSEVYLAERMSPLPERVILKLARPSTRPGAIELEANALRALQNIRGDGAAYFSRRLPQVIGYGKTEGASGYEREVMILRHPSGYWGSLAQVLHLRPQGIDPRHGVWIWRRVLDVLAYLHDAGWTHGDLTADHWLVHPRDHGVLLIGWGKAQPNATSTNKTRDLIQSAWTVRQLLCGGDELPTFSSRIPAPLAELRQQSSESAAWCDRAGARGIDEALLRVARESFGPPRFIPFHPTSA